MSKGFISSVRAGAVWTVASSGLLYACATALLPGPELPPLWRAVGAPAEPEVLRVEPLNSASRLGEEVVLHVAGTRAGEAICQLSDGESLALSGGSLRVPSPSVATPATIVCHAGELRAEAQITFTDARTLPVADPYVGGVVLFKLRELPTPFKEPVARAKVGLPSLDAKLDALSALVLPAFPFDRSGARDAVGLGLWVAIDLPDGVNFYQAVSWLRADPSIFPESYLPDDGTFLRVHAKVGWPTPFTEVTRALDPDSEGYHAAVRLSSAKRAPVNAAGPELDAIGAPQVWSDEQGDGVRLAVIDTGIDVNHASIAGNLLEKPSEREGDDFDGNGVPGDRFGVNLAQLAIATDDDGTRLALGVVGDVSDWDGVSSHTRRDWGHGTALASLAAGVGGAGLPLGVAPRAQIIAVDVQENLRTTLTQKRDDDPRMRDSEEPPPELRSSTWARAAGIAYAVGERARVLTCAWPGDKPHWILHDALLFAEDNCAIPICGPGDEPGATGAYPSHWRESWLSQSAGDSMGVVWDPWTDEESGDAILRPLRALVVAEVTPSAGTSPDLVLPLRATAPAGTPAAVSNPRNDQSTVPDRRSAPLAGSAAAVGLTAGAAAIVSGAHPDLEPWAVREALVMGAAKSTAGPALSVPGALAATGRLENGGACRALLRREPTPEASPWPKIRIKTNADQSYPGTPPASPEPQDAERRR